VVEAVLDELLEELELAVEEALKDLILLLFRSRTSHLLLHLLEKLRDVLWHLAMVQIGESAREFLANEVGRGLDTLDVHLRQDVKHLIRRGLDITFNLDSGVVLGQKKVSVRVEVRDKTSARSVYQSLNPIPKHRLGIRGGWRDMSGHIELGRVLKLL